MKKLIAILFVIMIHTTAYSQASVIQWQKDYGGSNSEFATAIQQTKDGGYIFAGPTQSDDSEVSGNHGAQDYWVVKVNDTGGIQWEVCLGGNSSDNAYAIQQTLDGGYLVTGGSATDSNGDVMCAIGEWEYWLVKLSDTGSIEWTGCYGNPADTAFNKAYAMQQTTDSGYILNGVSYVNGGDVTGNHGSGDYWVAKVSSAGAFLWGKSLGGSQLDMGEAVRQTTDGGYIVAGTSSSIDGNVTGNHGGSDYWVVKLDDTGAIQWQESLGGSGDEICYSIQQTTDGGYIVGGASNSTDGNVTGNHGGDDFWIVKLSETGAIQWQTSLGGAGDEVCYSIQQTADGGYIAAGSTDSTSGEVTGTHGGDDYWVVKLSQYGNMQWEKALGGSALDVAASIQQTSDSGFIVAGQTFSSDGDITKNFGVQDFWVVKLSTCVLDSPTIINTANTLSASAVYNTYQWYLNDTAITGATNATYTATRNGSYEVTVADTNGCKGTSIINVVTDAGVNTIYNNNTINIMPNPTTGIIYISGAGPLNISVYDLLGQLMKEADNAQTISIAELPAGIYFIRLSDTQRGILKQSKIIKE